MKERGAICDHNALVSVSPGKYLEEVNFFRSGVVRDVAECLHPIEVKVAGLVV